VAGRTLADVGRIDVLINNAGVVSGKPLLEITDDAIERTFAVNALAPIWMVRAFLPGMLERGNGHIVTIASAAGLAGTARLTDYCASKFAAVGFDEALRVELAQQGSDVVTTIVCPYFVATGMFDGVATRFSWLLPVLDPDRVVRRILRAIRRNRRRVVMPWFLYTVWPTRVLPVPLFDRLMKFFGAVDSMNTFAGRPDAADR
ncbi:MAG: SDR family NAD(P)-dependent oxidoreductase, partial [Woeseiaceae bacterium]|nr:SDR family NAD(P)-dependent oxidoreductase [Woeseiaceae bacterium]